MSRYGAFALALGTKAIFYSYASPLFISDAATIVARFETIVALGDIVGYLSCDWNF